MAFAKDRDLLSLEPRLFLDLSWLGQRLFSGDVVVTDTVVTSASADFVSAGVSAGHVLSVDGAGYEVVGVLSAMVLMVSVLRPDVDGPAIEPLTTGGAGFISTFGPQLEIVHGQVLRMAGIEPGSAEESKVTNGRALVLVECLGALHLIFAAASAGGQGRGLEERAEMYRRRFAMERQRAKVLIDTDGDGVSDEARALNAARFVRG